MIQTPVDLCNLALMKLGAHRISNIETPASPTEKLFAQAFPHYRDVELRARRWRFALATATLTPEAATLDGEERPYQFLLPTTPVCLRPIRHDGDTWAVYGRTLRDIGSAPVRLEFISRPEDFGVYDPDFLEVLACRLAKETCEAVTQSKTKQDQKIQEYGDALKVAKANNAFMFEPELVSDDDEAFSWVSGRYRYG